MLTWLIAYRRYENWIWHICCPNKKSNPNHNLTRTKNQTRNRTRTKNRTWTRNRTPGIEPLICTIRSSRRVSNSTVTASAITRTCSVWYGLMPIIFFDEKTNQSWRSPWHCMTTFGICWWWPCPFNGSPTACRTDQLCQEANVTDSEP